MPHDDMGPKRPFPGVSYTERGSAPSYDMKAYNTIGLHLGPWLWQAKGHNAAAHLQWKAARRIGTARTVGLFHRAIALMLAGFAIETLLKMVLIDAHMRTYEAPTSHAKLKEVIPTIHALRDLAAKARVRINAADRKTLDQLTNYAVWAGRYPVPLFATGYEGPAWMENWSEANSGRVAEIWTRYLALWPKLLKQAGMRLRT